MVLEPIHGAEFGGWREWEGEGENSHANEEPPPSVLSWLEDEKRRN